MKKLFFTALVAVVAVGGAYADVTLYDNQGQPIVTCLEQAPNSCSDYRDIEVYQEDGSTVIPSSAYTSLFYN